MKRANIVKEARVIHVIAAVFLVLAGILFVAWSDAGDTVTRWALGGALCVIGAARVLGYFANDLYRLAFQYDLALGLFCIIFAVLSVIRPDSIRNVIPYAVGVYVLMDGLLKLQTAFDAKAFGMKHWVGLLSSSVVVSVFGILVLVGSTMWTPQLLVGIALVLDGAENIWNTMGTVRVRAKKADRFEDLL
ncbi:MAG: DUF308 domain-containing protein [Clostridia bacterium]|nr:DUF308 domain-containing protein [Clostridia bacterium]